MLAFFFSFFLKRFFCGSAQQETINSGALPQILLTLNTQPPSFINLKLNIPFKWNLPKCLNATKCHKDSGKGRESQQNSGDKSLFPCISCPSSSVPWLWSHRQSRWQQALLLCSLSVPSWAEEGHEWQMKCCSSAFLPERAGWLWVRVTGRAQPAWGSAAFGCYLTLTSGMSNTAQSQLIISLSWIAHPRKWKMHLSLFLKLVVKWDCRLSSQFSNMSCQSSKQRHDEKCILGTQNTT